MIGEEGEEEKDQEQEKEEENKGSSKSLNSHSHMVAFHTEGTYWRKFTRRKRRNTKNLRRN
jgi:hypothetical protein